MRIHTTVPASIAVSFIAAATLTTGVSQAVAPTVKSPAKPKAVYLTSAGLASSVLPDLGGGYQLRPDGRALLVAASDRRGRAQLVQVWLRSQQRTVLSVPNAGGASNGDVSWASYLAGGSQVVYLSNATNLTSDPVNLEPQLFLRSHNRNTLLSSADATTPQVGPPQVFASANKRYAAWTPQQDKVPPDPAFPLRTWLYDSATGHLRQVVPRTANGAAIKGCHVSAISGTGARLLMTCGTHWELISTGTGTVIASLKVGSEFGDADLNPAGTQLAYYTQPPGGPYDAYIYDLVTHKTRLVPTCADYVAIAPAWNWMACAGMLSAQVQDFVASTTTSARWWLGTRSGRLAKSVFFSSFTADSKHAIIVVPNSTLGGPARRWNVYLQPLP